MNGFFLAPSRLLCARDTRGSRTTRLPRRSQTNAAEISVPSVKLQPVSPNYAKLQFTAFLPELQLRKTPPHEQGFGFASPSCSGSLTVCKKSPSPNVALVAPKSEQGGQRLSNPTESDRIGVNRTKSRLKRFFPSSDLQSFS